MRSSFSVGCRSHENGSERQRALDGLARRLRDGDADHGSAAANRTITSLKPTEGPRRASSLFRVGVVGHPDEEIAARGPLWLVRTASGRKGILDRRIGRSGDGDADHDRFRRSAIDTTSAAGDRLSLVTLLYTPNKSPISKNVSFLR
jgi:hypothetical protein